MNPTTDLDPRIRDWLADGPVDAPEYVVDRAFAQARAKSRPIWSGIWLPLGLPASVRRVTWAAVAVLAAALLIAGILLAGVGARHDLLVVPPTPAPSPSVGRVPPPTHNGPIAIGTTLRLIDPRSGTDVQGFDCSGCRIGDADWSPDGSTLVYTGPLLSGEKQLWTWRPGDISAIVIWSCVRVGCLLESPSWSPDGLSIVVNETDPTFTYSDLVVIDPDGTNERRIPTVGLRSVGYPSWTPGGLILFTAYGVSSEWLATIRPDGTGYRELPGFDTPDPPIAAMSPDGSAIAMLKDTFFGAQPSGSSGSSGGLQLWVEASDGTHARLIWQRPGCCVGLGFSGPEWSPDGKEIAIVAISSPESVPITGSDVLLMTFDVASGARVVLAPADPAQPAWRPSR